MSVGLIENMLPFAACLHRLEQTVNRQWRNESETLSHGTKVINGRFDVFFLRNYLYRSKQSVGFV